MCNNHQSSKKNSRLAARTIGLFVTILILAAIFTSTVTADSYKIVKTLDCENCGQIEGLVWNDQDWNGLRTYEERGIAAVFVRLWMLQDSKYQIHRAYYTGRDGVYIFDNLDIGSYRVEIVEPHSISLQHYTQTTLMSPTPVIDVQSGQTLAYNFSYAKAGRGMNRMMISHFPQPVPAGPQPYFHGVKYGPYPKFNPPAVFLNPYEGSGDTGTDKKSPGEKFSVVDIKGAEGSRH